MIGLENGSKPIEIEGCMAARRTVNVTKTKILSALRKLDDFMLAIVDVDGERAIPPYVRCAFKREPDFSVPSVGYERNGLLARPEETP